MSLGGPISDSSDSLGLYKSTSQPVEKNIHESSASSDLLRSSKSTSKAVKKDKGKSSEFKHRGPSFREFKSIDDSQGVTKWKSSLKNNYTNVQTLAQTDENTAKALSEFSDGLENGNINPYNFKHIRENLWNKGIDEDNFLKTDYQIRSTLNVYDMNNSRNITIESYRTSTFSIPGGAINTGTCSTDTQVFNISNTLSLPLQFFNTLEDILIILPNQVRVCTESPLKAAFREFKEETTLDIEIFLRTSGVNFNTDVSPIETKRSKLGLYYKITCVKNKYTIAYTLPLITQDYNTLIKPLTASEDLFYKNSSVEVTGIHFKKYLKYKNKYLELKNKLLNNNGEQ